MIIHRRVNVSQFLRSSDTLNLPMAPHDVGISKHTGTTHKHRQGRDGRNSDKAQQDDMSPYRFFPLCFRLFFLFFGLSPDLQVQAGVTRQCRDCGRHPATRILNIIENVQRVLFFCDSLCPYQNTLKMLILRPLLKIATWKWWKFWTTPRLLETLYVCT